MLWIAQQSEHFSGWKCCCKIYAEENELFVWRQKRSSRSQRKRNNSQNRIFTFTFLLTTSLNKSGKSVGNSNTGDYSSLSHSLDNEVDALSIHETRQRIWEPLLCNSLVRWQHLCTADRCRMQNQKKPISETKHLLFFEHERALFYPRQICRLLLSISWWRTKITVLWTKASVGILFIIGTTCHACRSTSSMWEECLQLSNQTVSDPFCITASWSQHKAPPFSLFFLIALHFNFS